jgi:hypothetical protein
MVVDGGKECGYKMEVVIRKVNRKRKRLLEKHEIVRLENKLVLFEFFLELFEFFLEWSMDNHIRDSKKSSTYQF